MSVVRRDRLPIRDAAHSHPIAAPPGGQDGLGVGSTLSLGLGPCQEGARIRTTESIGKRC